MDYDKQVEDMRKKNKKYLDLFKKSLEDEGMSPKTIKKHVSNVDLYINDYMLYYDVNSMESGTGMVDKFLGDWCIEKCLFCSKTFINESASGIKKFYKCMMENGFVKKEDYEYMCKVIKNEKSEWLDRLCAFDDGEEDWFF